MYRIFVFPTAILAASATLALANPTVTFTLASPQNGLTVAPGAVITWTISATASTGDNSGLALAAGDLVQNTANPSYIDLPPASGVPAGMVNFSRPLGVSNPGEGGATTGYIGVQRSPVGQTYKNLIQIGGGQNTFGTAFAPGTGIAESANVVAGVGLGTPVVIATGSVAAPAVAGVYEFHLSSGIANVLNQVNPPPQPPAFWPVSPALIQGLPTASFSFVVGAEVQGDVNCDGVVNTGDIPHFAQALIDPTGYDADHDGSPYPACQRGRADMTNDGLIDGLDIQAFVNALIGQ